MIPEAILNGRSIQEFSPDAPRPIQREDAWRVTRDYEDELSFEEKWRAFLAQPGVENLEVLVIGAWHMEVFEHDSSEAVTLLCESAAQLPNLKVLFFGDVPYEQSEISWLLQSDVGPLLNAFPKLTFFGVKGGSDLELSGCEGHEHLETLRIETGGLPAEVVNHLVSMKLPALKRLTLWLGSSDYGFDGDVDTYMPLIIGTAFPEQRYPFPALKHLGLQNSEIADELAAALQDAMVLDQLDSLDLSMGTLSDVGVQHLVDNEKLNNLKKLNLSSNYITDMNLVERLRTRGVEVDATEQKEEGDYGRYVDVAE